MVTWITIGSLILQSLPMGLMTFLMLRFRRQRNEAHERLAGANTVLAQASYAMGCQLAEIAALKVEIQWLKGEGCGDPSCLACAIAEGIKQNAPGWGVANNN